MLKFIISNIKLTFKKINLYDYSIKEEDYSPSLDKKMIKEFTFKFLSSRLNLRFYNKLSKEIGDFKDLENKYIYIQY